MMGVTLVVGHHFYLGDMIRENDFQIGFWGDSLASGRARFGGIGCVVIVNQSLARQFWPRESVVGKMICAGANAYEIVGVVRDFHQVVDNNDFILVVYYSLDLTVTHT